MSDPQYPSTPLGASYSQEELRRRIIDPLFRNDSGIDSRLGIIEAFIATLPVDFRQGSVPDSAKLYDRWFNTSENNQFYLCISPYDISESTKLSKWALIRDNVSASAASAAQATASAAIQSFVQSDVPASGVIGWMWADTDLSNKPSVCIETYLETDGPGGYSTIEEFRESKWAATDSNIAQLLAASYQGLQDNTINRILSATVPDAADGRDTWFNTSSKQSNTCLSGYDAEDHDPWSNSETYPIGSIRTDAGELYQATAENTNQQPPNVTYWAHLGPVYASKTVFRESRWAETVDLYARALAEAAEATADGKVELFIIENLNTDGYPEEADLKDQFVDKADSSQVYYCNEAYDNTLPVNDRAARWTPTSDSAAQAKAELASGQVDQKSTTYHQNSMPTGVEDLYYGLIGRGDGWVDTDDGNSTFVAFTSYKVAGTFLAITNANTDGAPYAGGTTYYLNDIVIYSGRWYKANQNSFSGQLPTNAGYWDDMGETSAATALEWQLEQWEPIADKNAQTLATQAQAAADGKSRTIVSSTLPNADNLGYVIDIGDIWLNDTNGQTYMSLQVQTPGSGTGPGSITYWQEVQDLTSKAIAEDAKSAVDNKRTTFYTTGAGDTYWPGPGEANQWPISFWDAVGSAQQGDLWYHTDTDTGNKFQRICDTAYDGYAGGDIGSKAYWRDMSTDYSIVTYVASQILPVQNQLNTLEGEYDALALAYAGFVATKGVAGGLASLNGSGKLESSQIPLELMSFKGNWDASANSPSLVNGTGDQGDTYRVSGAGSVDFGAGSLVFEIGDWVYYDGSVWLKGDNIDQDWLLKSGGTMTGTGMITLGSGTPSGSQAAKFSQIPTNNNQLTNGAGYQTAAQVAAVAGLSSGFTQSYASAGFNAIARTSALLWDTSRRASFTAFFHFDGVEISLHGARSVGSSSWDMIGKSHTTYDGAGGIARTQYEDEFTGAAAKVLTFSKQGGATTITVSRVGDELNLLSSEASTGNMHWSMMIEII